ncbi:MAG: hypothetical protein JKY33_07840 [Bacteroidia bacterium]|nr:hypothetical protein [Bacteroidia bacterium]
MNRTLHITSFIILIIYIFLAFGSVEDDNTTNNPNSNSQQITLNKEEQESLKKYIISLEQTLYSIEKPISSADKQFKYVSNLYLSGQATLYDIYKAAKVGREKCEYAQYDYMDIPGCPKAPQHLYDKINTLKSNFSTGLYTKKDAYDYALEFYNNGSLEDLDSYFSRMEYSTAFMTEAAILLAEIKNELGLFDKKEKSKKSTNSTTTTSSKSQDYNQQLIEPSQNKTINQDSINKINSDALKRWYDKAKKDEVSKEDNAIRLLKEGHSIRAVAKKTGLTKKEVRKIKDKVD